MAVVAVGGGGLVGVALAVLAAALLLPLWGRVRLRRHWTGPIEVRLRGIGAALRRTGPFAASSAMFTVLTYLDSVMVNAMRGNVATGLYGAAYRVLLAFTLIPAVYTDATARSISHLARADRPRMEILFRRAVAHLLILAIPIAVAGVILAGPILTFLYGPSFSGAATALALLMPSVLASFPGWLGVSVAYALGLERRLVLLTGAVVLANALANLALIPAWGIRGAAASTLGGDILILAGMAVVFRRGGLRWPSAATLAKPAAAGAIMLGVMIPLRTLPLVIPLAVGVTAYVAVLFLLRAFEAEDRELLRALVSRGAPTRELDGAP
jgi:O-antigen/teichoic acid export membrane protein